MLLSRPAEAPDWLQQPPRRRTLSSINAERQRGGTSQLRPFTRFTRPLCKQLKNKSPSFDSDMALYADLALQDSVKEQLFRCKLNTLERKCCTGVEKLKALIGEHLQSGLPLSELLEKTKSFLTLKKALLSHSGYSKYSRDILRLFPDMEEDLAPLCF